MSESDLLREAEDEIRRETVEGTAKKLAPFFIGAIILALIGGGAYQYWQGYQEKRLNETSVNYYAAMDKLRNGDFEGGAKDLEELAKNAPNGFATLATIQRGAVLQEKGDNPNALKAFDDAAKLAANADMKNLARLRAAYIASSLETKEKLDARLTDIINSKTAFVGLARELKAAVAWNNGDAKSAKAEYELLQLDPNVPEGLRARAGQAIAVIDANAELAIDNLQVSGAQNGGAPTSEEEKLAQAAAAQKAAEAAKAQGVEIGPDGKRIVRLPPGQKLPPGFKVPPDVRIVETPASPEMLAKMKAAQQKAQNDFEKQIDAERQKAMKQQEEVTKAQQKKVEEITKAGNSQTNETKPVE